MPSQSGPLMLPVGEDRQLPMAKLFANLEVGVRLLDTTCSCCLPAAALMLQLDTHCKLQPLCCVKPCRWPSQWQAAADASRLSQDHFVDKMDLESNRLHLANGRSVPLSQTSMGSGTDSGTWLALRAAHTSSPAAQLAGSMYHSASALL